MISQLLPFAILSSLLGVCLFLHLLYFVWLPQRVTKRYRQTNPERLRRYLEWVAATPSLIGSNPGLLARTTLISIYIAKGEHARAEAHCRANLKSLPKSRKTANFASLEASTRRHLADCLEALGRPDEADAERQAAEACLARAPGDRLRYITQGKLLERENRHIESVVEYENALAVTPESNRKGRVECMVLLALASHNAGRPSQTLRWAEQAIESGAEGTNLRSAHWMASVACGHLGRLDQAEEHARRAYEVAAAQAQTAEMGQILGSLAMIQLQRGKLVEAYQACEEAAKVDPKAVRMAAAVQSQVLKGWGRYEEALQALERHDQAVGSPIPAQERRLRAASNLERTKFELHLGRVDDAWAHVQEAVAELGTDPKLGMKCDSLAAWVFAARGLSDDSRRVAGQALAQLEGFKDDPSTLRGVFSDLGMAAWTRGDHDEGLRCWTKYLELNSDPVSLPTVHYYRGECRLALGDKVGAKADYEAAVACGLDTHHARLAQGRLREISLL